MNLLVGLGNPGPEYEKTPHNAGFLFVEAFREFIGWDSLYEVDDWVYDRYLKADISKARIAGEKKMIFLKPMTFMNKSGASTFGALKRFKLSAGKSLILIHDDLDIVLGKYKIDPEKSPKDHKGVESVVRQVGRDYVSVRIGVDNRGDGRPRIPGDEYVLQDYSEEELIDLNEVIAESSKHLRSVMEI